MPIASHRQSASSMRWMRLGVPATPWASSTMDPLPEAVPRARGRSILLVTLWAAWAVIVLFAYFAQLRRAALVDRAWLASIAGAAARDTAVCALAGAAAM